MLYSLTTPQNIKVYQLQKANYDTAFTKYEAELKKYQNKEITEYPKSPEYVYPPSLGYKATDIKNDQNLNLFKTYSVAIPDACANYSNSKIFNVNDFELESIGTASGLPLYRLKDSNHPLYKLAYDNKMGYYNFEQPIPKPTFDEYVKKNPLLFTRDPWQRWMGFGEYDILLTAGCGKPVVYLYPPKTTKVSVSFDAPVQFTVDIPKYNDGWQVLAHPDGSLKNLKQNISNCQQIDYSKRGSEYALSACQKNNYPYLYWAGNISSIDYPVINGGWIVKLENINNFLENKLSEMGLNQKEKDDFIGYWATDISAKNAPFYKISFLQTAQLDKLFPMTVSPSPDTTFRIFLDYQPLSELPADLPVPQVLNKLVRKGFTLVEWGGKKVY
jgi:hypothetical protein